MAVQLPIRFLAAALLAGLAQPAWASSAGLSFTGGEGYREMGLRGRVDLREDASWQAYASYAELRLGEGGGAWLSRQCLLGLEHSLSPALDIAGELIYGRDSGEISTLGAGGKAYYTFYRDGAGDAALERDIEAALSGSLSAAPGEIGGIFSSLDLQQYGIPSGLGSTSYSNPRGKTVSGSFKTNYTSLLQLHPSLGADLCLWDGALRPSLTGGYYFYTEDAAAAAGQGLLLSSDSLAASRASGLMSGLLRASWQAGMGVDLPWGLDLHADYGQQLLLNPEAWMGIYGLKFSKEFQKRLWGELGAQYSVLNGDGQWQGALGLRLRV